MPIEIPEIVLLRESIQIRDNLSEALPHVPREIRDKVLFAVHELRRCDVDHSGPIHRATADLMSAMLAVRHKEEEEGVKA